MGLKSRLNLPRYSGKYIFLGGKNVNLIYIGKTKDVYALEDGNYLLKLKDDATGKDGVFDPGENSVGLKIDGLGIQSLKMTEYFFKILNAAGIPNHFVDCDIPKAEMIVKAAKVFGKGLEVICRYRAVGSFFRRYGDYITEGATIPGLIEFTLKDDARQDPPLTKDSLSILGIMTPEEYEIVKELCLKSCNIIKDALAEKGLDLYDIKLEFGRCNSEITLIDEISAGNMRVYKNGVWLQPMEVAAILFD